MKYWLMKSEPEAYAIDDLKRNGKTVWDGIRNYQVRNMLRDDFAAGDLALFYHSNAGSETGVVGLMEVVGDLVVDPSQFDTTSDYYDPKSKPAAPTWVTRELKFLEKFPTVVTLSAIKADPAFSHLPLVQKGSRLSVMELTKKDFDKIAKLGRV